MLFLRIQCYLYTEWFCQYMASLFLWKVIALSLFLMMCWTVMWEINSIDFILTVQMLRSGVFDWLAGDDRDGLAPWFLLCERIPRMLQTSTPWRSYGFVSGGRHFLPHLIILSNLRWPAENVNKITGWLLYICGNAWYQPANVMCRAIIHEWELFIKGFYFICNLDLLLSVKFTSKPFTCTIHRRIL